METVAAAGGDPAALGGFLASLGDVAAPGGLGDLLSTHPLTAEREASVAARARAAVRGAGPLLPAGDWAAIQSICG